MGVRGRRLQRSPPIFKLAEGATRTCNTGNRDKRGEAKRWQSVYAEATTTSQSSVRSATARGEKGEARSRQAMSARTAKAQDRSVRRGDRAQQRNSAAWPVSALGFRSIALAA